MLAGYMVLRNNGDTAQVLEGATASGFEQVEIHRTTIHDGMASMEGMDSLSIPPQDSVQLAPGGYHLMLMMGSRPLQEGDTVDFSLRFKDGKTLEVHAPVRKDSMATEGHQHHHHD
jgi:hypothetical protein